MELNEQDVRNIIGELSSINSRLSRIEEAQKHPSPACAVHDEQIKVLGRRVESIEMQQGKQNLIAVTLGAIGAAIVLALKFLASRA